jgi:hypothetical protein
VGDGVGKGFKFSVDFLKLLSAPVNQFFELLTVSLEFLPQSRLLDGNGQKIGYLTGYLNILRSQGLCLVVAQVERTDQLPLRD